MKFCLHSSQVVQISLQFDEFFRKKKFEIQILRDFEISIQNFLGHPVNPDFSESFFFSMPGNRSCRVENALNSVSALLYHPI